RYSPATGAARGAGGLARDGARGGLPRGLMCGSVVAPRENSFDVLNQHVALDVDRGAWSLAPKRGQLERVRDQRDAEAPARNREYGQAHAVDRDRALLDQVARLRRRNFKSVQL